MDLAPASKKLESGRIVKMNDRRRRSISSCFYQTDLYTTFFGPYINDEIETILFGEIDNTGSKAVRAFIEGGFSDYHHNFSNFFSYMDSQKSRTPKGLDWIKCRYEQLDQVQLMTEMQAIRNMHCTLWTEGVREIVSAKESLVKFIISDHPVTVYNYACAPDSSHCEYPNDPSIALKGTQTIFPLNNDYCLILTNLEYAKDPTNQDPLEKRTHSNYFRQSMARTDAFIRTRELDQIEVNKINFILKSRAKKYVASATPDFLYPETEFSGTWSDLKEVLLPPADHLYHFGGEMYAGYEDGSTYYQDEFGRTSPENKYLKKQHKKGKLGRNDFCGCGSGKKYKKCCLDKSESDRPTWNERSIRERNLIFCDAISDILGLNKGKTWDDVRKELSNEHIERIYGFYGSLWPVETDILSLLPKPDGTLRALYVGYVDPRITPLTAIGATPYFEEIIIQQPFINPRAVNPEFSPVKSPHQYKQQTLKNIMLLFYLQPFIEAGFVNFIPDPCCFSNHLQRQMLNMAEARKPDARMDKQESARYEKLHKEDYNRTLRGFPKEYWVGQIRKDSPEISEEELEKMLDYIQRLNEDDPYSLLQETTYKDGGQLSMFNLSPNFEMSLYVAQATGSLLLTDSETRFSEFKKAQSFENDISLYPLSSLTSELDKLDYFFSFDPEENFKKRSGRGFDELRAVFKDVYSSLQKNMEKLDEKAVSHALIRLENAYKVSVLQYEEGGKSQFRCNMRFLGPKHGFADNNVLRLLLTSGSEIHLESVPLAVYMKFEVV
jgi:hypothetical protein